MFDETFLQTSLSEHIKAKGTENADRPARCSGANPLRAHGLSGSHLPDEPEAEKDPDDDGVVHRRPDHDLDLPQVMHRRGDAADVDQPM